MIYTNPLPLQFTKYHDIIYMEAYMEQKIINLIEYCQGIYKNKNGSELYKQYLKDIKTITPKELVLVENEQLKMGMEPKDMLTFVDKLINVFHESLSEHKLTDPVDIDFIHYLNEENKALTSIMNDFKHVVKTEALVANPKLANFLQTLQAYNEHLLKLENILFPHLEKKHESFSGLKIMWSLHDETRQLIKNIDIAIKTNTQDEKWFKIQVGQLYFKLFGLVQKQELILFPSSVQMISAGEFDDLHTQSFDYKFPYIDAPQKDTYRETKSHINYDAIKKLFTTETGNLKLDEVALLLNALPLDLTLVNEKDEVAFFTKPDKRIFPRSKAVIGRNVRNCHPPESVHVVEEILSSFKSGEKNEATFWIKMKGMMIYIQYIALRDDNGKYIGTLEITQEVSHFRALEGEKRLLD